MWISVDDGASSLKWEFVFYDGVRLLDIEFQFKAETFLYRVVALLDVSPELLEDGVRLYGDDLLPIRERSNIVLVVYCLSDDTYNFLIPMTNYMILPDAAYLSQPKQYKSFVIHSPANHAW